jgi:hypothetical protein
MSAQTLTDNWEFALGERVAIGDQTGTVMGQRTHVYSPDSFDVAFIDCHGLPVEQNFAGYQLVKERKSA